MRERKRLSAPVSFLSSFDIYLPRIVDATKGKQLPNAETAREKTCHRIPLIPSDRHAVVFDPGINHYRTTHMDRIAPFLPPLWPLVGLLLTRGASDSPLRKKSPAEPLYQERDRDRELPAPRQESRERDGEKHGFLGSELIELELYLLR